MEQWKRGAHGNTYGGNPLACAAANATLDLVNGGMAANAAAVGTHFTGRLRELAREFPCIGDVRGRGLMIGIELIETGPDRVPARDLCQKVIERAFHNGLLLLSCGVSTVRFMPPLNVHGGAGRRGRGTAAHEPQRGLEPGPEVRPLRRFAALTALLPVAWAATAEAAREPVLKQVDVPHSYYWRELYLPQLTTGPSSASFLPGGRELVYSMAGSLWRQTIGADEAVELTHATGAYDYQPDVSADGRSVVFSRYDGCRPGALASRSRKRSRAAPDLRWRGQRRAAAVAGWPATRVGFDATQRALRSARRRPRAGRASEREGVLSRAPDCNRPLLLLGLRPCDQPVLVPGRSAHLLRGQRGCRVGQRRSLVGRGRRPAGSSPRAARGDELERPARACARRTQACSIRAITGGSRISSGSRPQRVRRHCRSRSASSTRETRAGRRTARALHTSPTRTETPS